ncbi:SMI1/KNR4 family protein [Chitinophaga sp.]|uniref:SMI1/KNR4 family protein n=1 Tax=Chitinophaga sp. TaxID=1869181 RepID=UPI0031D8B7BE
MSPYEQLQLKYFSPQVTPPSSLFEEVEAFAGFPLPGDYLNYLHRFSAFDGDIGKQYLQLWGAYELVELNRLYELSSWLKYAIGIGSNGGGELIALMCEDNNRYKVIATPFISDVQADYIVVGNSFFRLSDGAS